MYWYLTCGGCQCIRDPIHLGSLVAHNGRDYACDVCTAMAMPGKQRQQRPPDYKYRAPIPNDLFKPVHARQMYEYEFQKGMSVSASKQCPTIRTRSAFTQTVVTAGFRKREENEFKSYITEPMQAARPANICPNKSSQQCES